MFDWLRAAGHWLIQYIINVPLYVAAPSMILIGALDSSLLSLPEINDYLVVMRCSRDPRVERAYARWGFMALAVPALLPPPMPFKIFVATAGALEYPRWRFMITIMIARSLRYYIEGTLAVFYGRRVLSFLKDNGMFIMSIVAGICIVGLAVYLLTQRGRAAVAEGKLNTTQTPEASASETGRAAAEGGAQSTDSTGG